MPVEKTRVRHVAPVIPVEQAMVRHVALELHSCCWEESLVLSPMAPVAYAQMSWNSQNWTLGLGQRLVPWAHQWAEAPKLPLIARELIHALQLPAQLVVVASGCHRQQLELPQEAVVELPQLQ